MTDYTPTTEEVREQYTREEPPRIGTVSGKAADFDRWLAQHNREVAAGALRALADEKEADVIAWERSTGQLLEYRHLRWIEVRGLRARADRIEQGGVS